MAGLWNRAGHYIFVLWFLLSPVFFMAALHSRCRHYIFALWFLLLLSFFFSSPNLGDRRSDFYHTWCGHSANLECNCEMCCTRMQKIAILAPSHNFVGLYLRN